MSRYLEGRYGGGRYYTGRYLGGALDEGAPVVVLPSADPVAVFGWPIYSDRSVSVTPSFSGGDWQSTLPLTNLSDRRLSRVARSVDATTDSTQFIVDLGAERVIGLLALVKHTMSEGARVRWSASDAIDGFGAPLYVTGWLDVWPIGATREDVDGLNLAHVHVTTDDVSARYWQCEIDDTANADDYVDVARLVIAGTWYPSTGMAVGAKLGMESATERVVTDGGAALYRQKAMRRMWDFSIPMLEEVESFQVVWKMIRQLGIHGQAFFVFDINDPFMHERAFLCVLRELSLIEYPYADFQSVPFRLLEEL